MRPVVRPWCCSGHISQGLPGVPQYIRVDSRSRRHSRLKSTVTQQRRSSLSVVGAATARQDIAWLAREVEGRAASVESPQVRRKLLSDALRGDVDPFVVSHTEQTSSPPQFTVGAAPVLSPRSAGRDWKFFSLGALVALTLHYTFAWWSHTPFFQHIFKHFVWWKQEPERKGNKEESTALVLYQDNAETVEWVNMCWRKIWRVYQRGLERWLADLLQPVFDDITGAPDKAPSFVQRLRILEFTLDHEAPYFSNMRQRTSRKDSDLNGVVDVRYTGGARLLLLIEVGVGRWKFKVPVMVSDLDLECKLWLKLRLGPMCPYVGTISLAFVGPPTIKVQLLPYNRVKLMRIPILQAFLTKLLTVDLPKMMELPKRLEINIPPAVTAVAEAAVGRDAVMRAVASAVLQADALEHVLMSALPLGPQAAAGGISLPDSFIGELQVTLLEARDLPVWGFPWQSNPYCRLTLGGQVVRSRRDDDTSRDGSHRAPVWNQEFFLLVEDVQNQVLEIAVRDSHMTLRPDVGRVSLPLNEIPQDGKLRAWLPVASRVPGARSQGELHLEVCYKPFEDDEHDSGYREAEAYARSKMHTITDVKSAADASSRAAVAASASMAANAVTKAAAARAAAKAAVRAKKEALRRMDKIRLEQAAAAGLGGDSGGNGALPAGSNGAGPAGADELGARGPGPLPSSRDVHRYKKELKEAVKQAVEAELYPAGRDGAGPHDGIGAEEGHVGASGVIATKKLGGTDSDGNSAAGSGSDLVDMMFPAVEYRITEEDDEDSPLKAQLDAAVASAPERISEAESQHFRSNEMDEPVADDGPMGTLELGDRELPDSVPVGLFQGMRQEAGHRGPDGDTVELRDPTHQPGPRQHKPTPDEPATFEVEGHLEEQEQSTATSSSTVTSLVLVERGPPEKKGWDLSWLGWLERLQFWKGFGVEKEPAQAPREKGYTHLEEGSNSVPLVDAIVVPPDLPLEEIAEEVKKSWRLKEVHVENMLQNAVAKSERPWLILLSTLSTISVVLLALVFYRLSQMTLSELTTL